MAGNIQGHVKFGDGMDIVFSEARELRALLVAQRKCMIRLRDELAALRLQVQADRTTRAAIYAARSLEVASIPAAD
jgi:hypothetical protein